MKTTLFTHEFGGLRRSTIIWSLSLTALSVGFLCLYPLFANDIAAAKQVLDKFPPAFKQLFDLNLDTFTSVVGFFSYLFNFLLLAGSIQALNLGLRALSKEENEKTVDFLLTKPVSRNAIVSAKLRATACSLVITNVVFLAGSLLAARLVSADSFNAATLLLIAGSLLWVQLLFAALGFWLSTVLKRIKSVVGVSMPIVFAFFILGALGSAIGDVDISKITPFKYFDTSYILEHTAYDIKYVILTGILVIVFVSFSYQIYRKRDIHAV